MEQVGPNDDTNKFPALHQALIDQLKQIDCLHTPSVEAAFRAVPRHLFLPDVPLDQVYSNESIPTKQRQGLPISSSSQPAIMAIMLEQLGLEPGHRVLEIGAGTGYNAALMAHIVGDTGHVVTIDIDEDLVTGAREHLAAAGLRNVTIVCGDGGVGYPSAAPYDRIILTVGAWDVAPAWHAQLHPRGRLVLPLSLKGPQRSVAFEQANGYLTSVSVADCLFIRLRGAFAGPESVVRLGPVADLYLVYADDRSIDAEAIYQALTQPGRDRGPAVCVTPREMVEGLNLWRALREPDLCTLVAQGEAAARGLAPYLSSILGKFCAAVGILAGSSMCMLMRPPDHAPPPERSDDAASFELFLRSFGPDETLADRLIQHLIAWDAADRPSTAGLRIRAYPQETDYTPSAHEYVVAKQWTQLVLDWPLGA